MNVLWTKRVYIYVRIEEMGTKLNETHVKMNEVTAKYIPRSHPPEQFIPLFALTHGANILLLGVWCLCARSQCVSVANIGFVSSWVECTVYEDVLCVYFVYIYVYVTAFSWFTVGLVVLCLYMPLNINPNDCQQHWNSHSLAVVADVDCTGCNTVPK